MTINLTLGYIPSGRGGDGLRVGNDAENTIPSSARAMIAVEKHLRSVDLPYIARLSTLRWTWESPAASRRRLLTTYIQPTTSLATLCVRSASVQKVGGDGSDEAVSASWADDGRHSPPRSLRQGSKAVHSHASIAQPLVFGPFSLPPQPQRP